MPALPPSAEELLARAERALAHCDGEAQALVRWTRSLRAGDAGVRLTAGVTAEVTVVRGGRAGRVVTTELDDDGLRRAAAGAAALADARVAAACGGAPGAAPGGGAGGAAARLGDPAAGRTHDGYDPAALRADADAAAGVLAASPAGGGGWRVTAAKLAVASTRGVRVTEQRSSAALRVRAAAGLSLTEVAAGAAAGDAAGRAARLAEEAAALCGAAAAGARGEPGPAPGPAVVLGPWAVAAVLQWAAPAFAGGGALAGRLGTRVVAPSVNLSDSPRYPGTVPCSYDAEGVPAQPVPLIQDGVAHRVVHDATSAAAAGTASTGHAVLPAGLAPPRPRHLVLVGGGAGDLDDLAAGAADGLLVPVLRARRPAYSAQGRHDGAAPFTAVAEGVRVIRDGRAAAWRGTLAVTVDPLAVLAQVQALTAAQRTVPDPDAPPWSPAATVAPGLRARGGVTPLGEGVVAG